MNHQYVQQKAGKAGTRGFMPNLDLLMERLNLGFLKATLVAAAVLAGLAV